MNAKLPTNVKHTVSDFGSKGYEYQGIFIEGLTKFTKNFHFTVNEMKFRAATIAEAVQMIDAELAVA